jgi:predicted small secreted protein
MKKLAFVLASLCMLAGCGKNEVHWSHKECVDWIVESVGIKGEYIYSVKEIEHDYTHGDDEVYCFEITVRAEGKMLDYYCFAVVDDGELMYVDCDYIG